MFSGKGNSQQWYAQGLIKKSPSPTVAPPTITSLPQPTARDPKGKGYSRDNFVQGLIGKKPSPPKPHSPPKAPTPTKSLRQPTAGDPIGGKESSTTSCHQKHTAKNSDASIGMTDESSSQGTTNFSGSIVSTVDSEHPTTTTTTCKSLDSDPENPATCSPPPAVVQVQIHHDYDNNHDHDDTLDDTQEESASDILRQKKLKALMDEHQRFYEMMRTMEQAIQDLQIAGEGKGDDTITLGSRESTVVTVQSTPYTSPATNVEARVRTTNSVKSDKDTTTPDVIDIEWTVAAPLRRTGRYTGPALSGKIPHGSGILIFDDEEVYEGPFKYGVMQGSDGLLMSASGATYKGGFRLNLRHGYGEEVLACGSRHVGKYEKGLPHGFGERHNPDGTLFFVGQWVQGEPAGLEESDSNAAVNSESSRDFLTFRMEEVVLPRSALQHARATKMCESIEQRAGDECMICLEAFSQDNPRIRTQCGCGTNKTCFHLPCLYQWKEQSEECPVCRQFISWEE